MPVIAAHAVQLHIFIADSGDVVQAFEETALVVQQCRDADFHAFFLFLFEEVARASRPWQGRDGLVTSPFLKIITFFSLTNH